MKFFKTALCLILALSCAVLCCCAPKSNSLTADYVRSDAVPEYDFYSDESVTPENYQDFVDAYFDFSAKLLTGTKPDKSTVVSPLSLYTALAMLLNGTDGKTYTQLQNTLAADIGASELNTFVHYLNSRISFLNSDKGNLNSANSLWIQDSFSVKSQFLQTVTNYYDAEVFRTVLSQTEGADKINEWIKDNTDGKIDSVINNLTPETAMVLVNTLLFDDEWITPYTDADIKYGVFKGVKGDETTSFMTSNEMLIESTDAKGFVKNFANTPCKFVAILPNENITLEEYLISLSGAKLNTIMNSINGTNRCLASIPKFKIESSHMLGDTVKSMGAELMFTKDADFKNLTMTEGLYVSDILQKSFIEISPVGAKAGAATVIDVNTSANPNEFENLKFDRPFVFMIIENECNLPLFIGTVNNLT